MTLSCVDCMFCVNFAKVNYFVPELSTSRSDPIQPNQFVTLCTEPPPTHGVPDEASTVHIDEQYQNGTRNGSTRLPKYYYSSKMQISETTAPGLPATGSEPCRFPKLEECAHFHYERVQLPQLLVTLQTSMDQSLHSQHTNEDDTEYFMVQVTSGDECWLLQRNFENFKMLDDQLHQCIFDRKISQLPDISKFSPNEENLESKLICYLERLSKITDNSVNCGPVLNWLQMDNKGHRLLVPSEESRSINTPAVAAAYSVRRYVSQARDELNLEVGDMISVIDMASPGESMWWRGKRGFQVGFFPQHCVHIIGDKVPRNMPLPPPVVGSLALTPIKPVLRKHGKLITFFRSFILNRPSRRRLKQSGILKERVFGCDLGEHLLNTGKDVPTVLKCCAEFIETKGIVDGIYRLSGVTSNIQKLRNAFDEDRVPDLYTEDILKDIHSVASLLKMYFRELPNPLCTYQLYQSFVNAVQGCSPASRNPDNDHERLLKMREAVQKLPPPHYRTLEYLMRHLARVAAHAENTGMTTRNVAIVWAPNLLRCESLEVGGVAALQGVGVQAVVTEFLICYADLIFCDHLPSIDRPDLAEKENLLAKKCRPNSLNIATPTKLITLEEARSKHNLLNKTGEECSYIEVGGGPNNLPKKYHTIIELPSGARKRGHTKRSPSGWKTFFTKSRSATGQGAVLKNRKISDPILINEKSVTESDLTDMKRKLRTVKSAESLTSGHSEPASTEDVLGPLHSLHKPPGHNRSVSHDSYFDTLQSSQNNSEGSLLDLSEIHLNFDLEESEMRIFSEDESLVSSPRIQKDNSQRKHLLRARPEDAAQNLTIPSPKKQARVVLSPESASRKRTRLEDQLSDIQYIDCNTPENLVSTTAMVHQVPASPCKENEHREVYQPKNKSPRNSDNLDTKRQSLNLESTTKKSNPITKSFTELDINKQYLNSSVMSTPSVSSPGYNALRESSGNTTPGFSPNFDLTPSDLMFKKDNYENILTTINITYRSPPSSIPSSPVYENVVLNPEKVDIPTTSASLPQEAKQPDESRFLTAQTVNHERPKSLSALEDCQSTDSTLKANSSGAICNTSEQISLNSFNDQKTLSSNQSSESNIQFTQSSHSPTVPYNHIRNSERLSPTDLSLSEVLQSSTENLTTSQGSLSFPMSPSKNSLSPNVSPTSDARFGLSSDNLLSGSENVSVDNLFRPTSVNLIDFSPSDVPDSPSRSVSQNDKRKSDETEFPDEYSIYQQVKNFRHSVHEVNALLDLENEEKLNTVTEESKDNGTNDYEDLLDLKNDCGVEGNVDIHIYEDVEIRDECKNDKSSLECDQNEYDSLEDNFELVIPPENEYEELNPPKKDNEKTEPPENEVLEQENVERFNVKDLKSIFEEKSQKTSPKNDVDDNSTSSTVKLRKNYEKDSLPPCLRARNVKHQMKTRSLDEEEFEKEFLNEKNQRNDTLPYKSTSHENVHYKTNSLPKTLNQPKKLPKLDGQVESIHLAHSGEKMNSTGNVATAGDDEEQKKRERIEKYKEERRRILHERFRSESFKENKDVLMSRLKIYKSRDENLDQTASKSPVNNSTETSKSTVSLTDTERPPRTRRRSTRSDSEKVTDVEGKAAVDSGELSVMCQNVDRSNEPSDNAKTPPVIDRLSDSPEKVKNGDGPKPMTNSLKNRAAIFERNSQKPPKVVDYSRRPSIKDQKFAKNPPDKDIVDALKPSAADNLPKDRTNTHTDKLERDRSRCGSVSESDDAKELDFIRQKTGNVAREERRRHTYETREREMDADRVRRVSLENNRSPRKEKMSPTYCIKDMKALFESKSQQ